MRKAMDAEPQLSDSKRDRTRVAKQVQGMLLCVWAMALAGCFLWICCYSNSAGAIEQAPIQRDAFAKNSGATILLYFHPRCPCSWATARQLERITSDPNSTFQIMAYSFSPTNMSEVDRANWNQTGLVDFIAKLPNTQVFTDVGGAGALQYGALTSGTVLFYDSQGSLRFQGGITSSRGHEGDSIGSDALVSLLSNQNAYHSKAPVFGCPLFP